MCHLSLSLFFKIFIYLAVPVFSFGIQAVVVPCPGIEPGPPAWEFGVLATGPPGKPHFLSLKLMPPHEASGTQKLCSRPQSRFLHTPHSSTTDA